MPPMALNFALVGAAGFVAPRHMRAIADTGNTLVAAVDPHDSVGIIDAFFPEAAFFTEVERFDRFLEKRRRLGENDRVHYLSICSPNYLHDAHVRLALRVGAHAICEKPLVLSPWNLDQLAALEQEYGRRVYSVLQLRLLPQLRELKQRLGSGRANVELTYITPRGRWHDVSWKGVPEKSGGLALNIGVHFFDALIWMFGLPQASRVYMAKSNKMSGVFELERARVSWFLSVDRADMPAAASGQPAYRLLRTDGQEIEFSSGFPELHTAVYRDVLAGGGFSIDDARPAIQLAHDIRMATAVTPGGDAHRLLRQ